MLTILNVLKKLSETIDFEAKETSLDSEVEENTETIEKMESEADDIDEIEADSSLEPSESPETVAKEVNIYKELRRRTDITAYPIINQDPIEVKKLATKLAELIEYYRSPEQKQLSDITGDALVQALETSIHTLYFYFAHAMRVYAKAYEFDPSHLNVKIAYAKLHYPDESLLLDFLDTYESAPAYLKPYAENDPFLRQLISSANQAREAKHSRSKEQKDINKRLALFKKAEDAKRREDAKKSSKLSKQLHTANAEKEKAENLAAKSKASLTNSTILSILQHNCLLESSEDASLKDSYLLERFFEVLQTQILAGLVNVFLGSSVNALAPDGSKMTHSVVRKKRENPLDKTSPLVKVTTERPVKKEVGVTLKDLASIPNKIYAYFSNPKTLFNRLVSFRDSNSDLMPITAGVGYNTEAGGSVSEVDTLSDLDKRAPNPAYREPSQEELAVGPREIAAPDPSIFSTNDNFMGHYFNNYNFLGIAGEVLEVWKDNPTLAMTYFDLLKKQSVTKSVLEVLSDYSGDKFTQTIPSSVPILTIDLLDSLINTITTLTGAAIPVTQELILTLMPEVRKTFEAFNPALFAFDSLAKEELAIIHTFLLTVSNKEELKNIDFSDADTELDKGDVKSRTLQTLNKKFLAELDPTKKEALLDVIKQITNMPSDNVDAIISLANTVIAKKSMNKTVSFATDADKEVSKNIRNLSDAISVILLGKFSKFDPTTKTSYFNFNGGQYQTAASISNLLFTMSKADLMALWESIKSGALLTNERGTPAFFDLKGGPAAKLKASFPINMETLIGLKTKDLTEANFQHGKLAASTRLLETEYLYYFTSQLIPPLQKVSAGLRKLPLFLINLVEVFKRYDTENGKLSEDELDTIAKARLTITKDAKDRSNLKTFFSYLRQTDLETLSTGLFSTIANFFLDELVHEQDSYLFKPIKAAFMLDNYNALKKWLLQYYKNDLDISLELKHIFKDVEINNSFLALQSFLRAKTNEIERGLSDHTNNIGTHTDKLKREFDGIKRGIYQYYVPSKQTPELTTETPQTSGEDSQMSFDISEFN